VLAKLTDQHGSQCNIHMLQTANNKLHQNQAKGPM